MSIIVYEGQVLSSVHSGFCTSPVTPPSYESGAVPLAHTFCPFFIMRRHLVAQGTRGSVVEMGFLV